ncbi:MAG: hypothetical protein ACRC8Y_24425 [Chroococcales cyanobacterium]
MNIKAELETILNISILEVREWAYVLWVRPLAGKCTLVSKKILTKSEVASIEPLEFDLEAGRRGSKPWVARIDGLDQTYGFERQFVQPIQIEWAKRGCKSATFRIEDLGYYQDSSDGYWEAIVQNNEICCRECSYQEVKTVIEARYSQKAIQFIKH